MNGAYLQIGRPKDSNKLRVVVVDSYGVTQVKADSDDPNVFEDNQWVFVAVTIH